MATRPQLASWTEGALIARRYRLVEHAPERGIVPVWKALDTQRRNRDVALSRLPQTAAVRALSEAVASPKADHPDVLLPLEIGRYDDAGYLVTAWRDGETLERWLARFEHRRPSTRLAWRCIARLCAQLETVHRAREGDRVHGWLSPRSLLVTDPTPDTADQLAVMDLGLAALGVFPSWRRDDGVEWSAWLAPEQAGGAFAPSQSADVFALAVVMTELLTGHPLAIPDERLAWWQLASRGDHAVRARLHRLRPELMGAPVDLLAQALCADPARRFPDAGVLRKALRQAGVKMAVERAGTAAIRAPHHVERDDAPAFDREAPAAPQAFAEAPWAPAEPVTEAQEVSPYADEFRGAFAADEFPATEPLLVRAPSGRDLFATDAQPLERTAPFVARDEAFDPGADAFTTPMLRGAPGAAPSAFAPVHIAVTEAVRTGPAPRVVTAPSDETPRWMIAAVACFLAVAMALFVYVMAR